MLEQVGWWLLIKWIRSGRQSFAKDHIIWSTQKAETVVSWCYMEVPCEHRQDRSWIQPNRCPELQFPFGSAPPSIHVMTCFRRQSGIIGTPGLRIDASYSSRFLWWRRTSPLGPNPWRCGKGAQAPEKYCHPVVVFRGNRFYCRRFVSGVGILEPALLSFIAARAGVRIIGPSSCTFPQH